jgi:chromate transporter
MSNAAIIAPKPPGLGELFIQFLTIGAVSFGGGIVAYERALLVDHKKWVDADSFMAALALSQTLPGLNSVNLAAIIGQRMAGLPGAIVSVVGLILPGAILVLILGILYDNSHDDPLANLALASVAAAATGLVANTVRQLGRKRFRDPLSLALIAVTFTLMSILKLSLPIVLLLVFPVALWLNRPGARP